MSKPYSYHDISIIGILHDQKQNRLLLQTESGDGIDPLVLCFNSVVGWDLSPFEDQNVLFNLHEFEKKNLPDWIKKDFEVPKEYLNSIDSGDSKLFYLESSVGLGGYIVANSLSLSV